LEYQVALLFWRKNEGKILRKPLQVASHGLVQIEGRYAIEAGMIRIEHHSFSANDMDSRLDMRDRQQVRFVSELAPRAPASPTLRSAEPELRAKPAV